MIPKAHILEWASKTPWPEEQQVEQDLLICRALVAVFSDEFLGPRLAFRGGTALNKLYFNGPYRYSEDIDLVQIVPEPIGATIDALRRTLDTWLGRGSFQMSEHSPKMIYKVDGSEGRVLRLKVEINTREHVPYFQHVKMPFSMDSEWFSGAAEINTFLVEEILATKFRALLQRDKGRDVFDLGRSLEEFDGMDIEAVVKGMSHYLGMTGSVIHRAEAEQRLLNKLKRMTMLDDMRPLVPIAERHLITEDAARKSIAGVFCCLVGYLPGKSWAKSPEMIKETGLESFLNESPRGHSWQPT